MKNNATNWPWLSTVLGSAATVIGVILTTTNAQSTADNAGINLILGGVLTTFGPVVISHVVSKNLGRKQAREELVDHIESISQNLGHSVAALETQLNRNAAHVDSPEVTLSVVRNLVSTIEVQIGQLQKLIGEPFSAATLVATKEEIVALADSLSKAAESNDPQAVIEASRDIDKVVRKLVKRPGELITESLRCPGCGLPISQEVGTVPGSTARVNCSGCGSTFNAHRSGDGSLFTRLLSQVHPTSPALLPAASSNAAPVHTAGPIRPQQVELPCPQCAARVKFWLDTTQTENLALCLECNTAMTVDSAGTTVAHRAFERVLVPVSRAAARSGFLVLCPRCGGERTCRIRLGGAFFGYCSEDALTLEVSAVEVSEHRLTT